MTNNWAKELKIPVIFVEVLFIDAEFIKYLRKIFGDRPMNLLRDNHYREMQYMIH